MRWYNNTDEIQPMQSKGLDLTPPSLINQPPLMVQQAQSQPTKSGGAGALNALLQIGGQVAGTIASQRQASGKAAERQARIAACGRKGLGYLFSKRRKEEYKRCVEQASAYSPSDKSYSPPPPPSEKSNLAFIIVAGVLVIGGISAYFIMKKK